MVRTWRTRNSYTLLVRGSNGSVLRKTLWRALRKLNIDLPREPTIPRLERDPEELNRHLNEYMSIAALFTRAKRGANSSKGHTQTNQSWYIMEYYSAIKIMKCPYSL